MTHTIGRSPLRSATAAAMAAVALCSASLAADYTVPTVNPSSSPSQLTAWGDALYFVADDGIHGRELWTADRGGTCRLVADLAPGADSSNPNALTPAGDWLYFTAERPDTGRELFFVDRDTNEVTLVADLGPGESTSRPRPVGPGLGAMFFFADIDGGRWACSVALGGTDVRQLMIARPGGAGYEHVPAKTLQDGSLVFFRGGTLCRTDGTNAGTRRLLAVSQDSAPLIRDLTEVGDLLFFTAQDAAHGHELWAFDPKDDSARLVKDIAPGESPSSIASIHRYGAYALFSADDGVHGGELWRSDGTEAGTRLVKDIAPGRQGSDVFALTTVGDQVFFLANDGHCGRELWVTDGTEAGTRLACDLYPGIQGSDPWRLTAFKDRLYFCASTPDAGDAVFSSDGTVDGTGPLWDSTEQPHEGGPHELMAVDDVLFFIYDEPTYGEELWMTDGTPAGTRLACDINPPRHNPSSTPRSLTAVGDRLYFVVADARHGEELWASDGTEPGTRLVVDASPGPNDGSPRDLTPAGTRLFFTACTPDAGRGLWMVAADGQDAVLVKEARPGNAVESPICAVGDRVYFVVEGPDGVPALWSSDGSAEGTRAEPALGNREDVESLAPFDFRGRVYCYVRYHGEPGIELWSVTGQAVRLGEAHISGDRTGLAGDAAAEPQLACAAHPPGTGTNAGLCADVNGTIFFVACGDACGSELWRWDDGKERARLVCDVFPGPASSSPSALTCVGNRLYFLAERAQGLRVLWCTDGSAEGTYTVSPWAGGSARLSTVEVQDMAVCGDALIVSGRQAGQTDNVAALGIVKSAENGHAYDMLPSPPGPRDLTGAGDKVFFVADDGIHGAELWVTDGDVNGTHLVRDILTPGDLTPYPNGGQRVSRR